MAILIQDIEIDKGIKLAQEAKKAEVEFQNRKFKIHRIDYVIYSSELNEWADQNSVNVLAANYEDAERELLKHIPVNALRKNLFQISSRQENFQAIDLISEPIKRRLYEWLKGVYENGK